MHQAGQLWLRQHRTVAETSLEKSRELYPSVGQRVGVPPRRVWHSSLCRQSCISHALVKRASKARIWHGSRPGSYAPESVARWRVSTNSGSVAP
jgi:hypothetical protein